MILLLTFRYSRYGLPCLQGSSYFIPSINGRIVAFKRVQTIVKMTLIFQSSKPTSAPKIIVKCSKVDNIFQGLRVSIVPSVSPSLFTSTRRMCVYGSLFLREACHNLRQAQHPIRRYVFQHVSHIHKVVFIW